MSGLEKLSFRLVQTSKKLGAFTDRTTRIVCMICNLGRTLLISLDSTSQSANENKPLISLKSDTASVPLPFTSGGA